MPDTVRLLPTLQGLLADNATGDISPQDARDVLVSDYRDYIMVSDVKAAGTEGGGMTAGAWRTRDINTEDSDLGGHAAIAANQITLQAGEYVALISVPAYKVTRHKAKLENITDGATLLVGTSEICPVADGVSTRSLIIGRFTIAAAKVLEVQHQSNGTQAVNGFGTFTNVGVVEVYTVAQFWWRTP